jgi:hypothetical protein
LYIFTSAIADMLMSATAGHSHVEGDSSKGRQAGVFLGQVKREAQVAASMLTSDEQGGFMRLTNFAVDDGPHNSDGLMLYGWHGINR